MEANVITDFTGAGWAFPLNIGANGAFAVADGNRKLEQAMRLILSTYPGERPMRPEFGSRLRDYVFAPATTDNAAELASVVDAALLRWEPRVDVDRVTVYPAPDQDSLLYIDIEYTVKATNDRRNLVFPFYIIPDHRDE
jgi:phage baseplate assembly protein W